jgi:hypothetical protein
VDQGIKMRLPAIFAALNRVESSLDDIEKQEDMTLIQYAVALINMGFRGGIDLWSFEYNRRSILEHFEEFALRALSFTETSEFTSDYAMQQMYTIQLLPKSIVQNRPSISAFLHQSSENYIDHFGFLFL